MTIPGTSKDIIKVFLNEYGLSVSTIAQRVGVVPKTIYEILNDKPPHPHTDLKLIHLYLKLKHSREPKNFENKKNHMNIISIPFKNPKKINTASIIA